MLCSDYLSFYRCIWIFGIKFTTIVMLFLQPVWSFLLTGIINIHIDIVQYMTKQQTSRSNVRRPFTNAVVEVLEWQNNFIPHFDDGCDYLPMLRLKLIHVSKMGPRCACVVIMVGFVKQEVKSLPYYHIYASMNRVSIGSDNGLSPIRHQAII